MRRVWAILCFYLLWPPVLRYVVAAGVVLVVLGIVLALLSVRVALLPLMLGAMLTLGVPAMTAGIVFRYLAGNRRILMLPHYREFAVIALLVLATATCAVMTLIVWCIPEANAGLAPARFALTAFLWTSGYLLVSQWLIRYPVGFLCAMFLPLLLVRLNLETLELWRVPIDHGMKLLIAVVLAWLWLYLLNRNHAGLRKIPFFAALAWSGAEMSPRWTGPQFGRMATAIGTYMRGMNDSLATRITAQLGFIVGMPLLFVVLFLVIGMPPRVDQESSATIGWLLFISFYGAGAFSFIVWDWSARLRYVWLRAPGDRAALWSYIERMLLQEFAGIAIIVLLTGAVVYAVTECPVEFVLLYVFGSIPISLLLIYAALLLRLMNQGMVSLGIPTMVVMVGGGAMVSLFIPGDELVTIMAILVVASIVLAFICRALALSRFMRVDWSALRPLRVNRAALGGTA